MSVMARIAGRYWSEGRGGETQKYRSSMCAAIEAFTKAFPDDEFVVYRDDTDEYFDVLDQDGMSEWVTSE
jgi:hypothetical protein